MISMKSVKRRILMSCLWGMVVLTGASASPIDGLLERIDRGASHKFVIEKRRSAVDFFELDQRGQRVVVRGNSYVNIAAGINWYLKYYAGIHLSWNGMQAKLPDVLPPVRQKVRRETGDKYRYYLNYCTLSYTMVFWDWKRWEREIDWMALHGINLPLAAVGTDVVWRNVLTRLGYTRDEINSFIAGPAFQAWWLMNNLEGWGGPNTDHWYAQREALQKKILKRMRELDIEPVLPGYAGMVPHDARQKLGLNVADPGYWCAYHRPAFLQPTDARFQEIADLYYREMDRLYGKARFYSMDPFHEGGNTRGVDLAAAGQSIMQAMKRRHPQAVWVVQSWQSCPYDRMISALRPGDLLVLDLFAESRPQWGDSASTWFRTNGFGRHNWIYCMLLNFGGNVGLHGKMQHVIDEYYKACRSRFGATLSGVGLTMEGCENNPVMYELLTELPWRPEPFSRDEWLRGYVTARYGRPDSTLQQAWLLLANSVYNCPAASVQQGTHESVFCARPSDAPYQVSSWSDMSDYYRPADVYRAAELMLSVADSFRGNNNFEYDLVDVVRQAVAEKGREVMKTVTAATRTHDKAAYQAASARFLRLLSLQDELLGTRPEFRLGTWTTRARALGADEAEKDWLEWNARVQITTWGNRAAAEDGGLRDYAHREWNGLLRDFYGMRWQTWFCHRLAHWNDSVVPPIDFYALEEPWTRRHQPYSARPEGDCLTVARRVWAEARGM